MTIIKVSQFVKLVPEAARELLPANLRKFKVALMPWLSQLYYSSKLIHYELVKLPDRFGENKLEFGYHFESRQHPDNSTALEIFRAHIWEVRDQLGESWVAEQWDRGWTKIYTTTQYTVMDEELVASVAQDLAKAITVLEPIYRLGKASEKE